MNKTEYQKFKSQKRIIGKYAALHEACCQYSGADTEIPFNEVPLQGETSAGKGYAENGFIETFCQ